MKVMIDDVEAMQACLAEAKAAAAQGEVPVGAVVVRSGTIIGRGRNAMIRSLDPTAHAEILALRAAATAIGNYRLVDADLIVTVEPCLMCVGAMLHARVRRVVFGCADPKGGALGSIADFSDHPQLNHRLIVVRGVCEAESRALLQSFFRQRRDRASE
jgi:tRNA(adenine34) deaminase